MELFHPYKWPYKWLTGIITPINGVISPLEMAENKRVTGLISPTNGVILLMEEILHHLGCIKPCKWWDIYHSNWLARFLPSTVTPHLYLVSTKNPPRLLRHLRHCREATLPRRGHQQRCCQRQRQDRQRPTAHWHGATAHHWTTQGCKNRGGMRFWLSCWKDWDFRFCSYDEPYVLMWIKECFEQFQRDVGNKIPCRTFLVCWLICSKSFTPQNRTQFPQQRSSLCWSAKSKSKQEFEHNPKSL